MNTTTNDLTLKIIKLPIWAQEHIQNCERRREMAETELKRFLAEQPQSNLYIKSHTLNIGDRRFLPTDEVTFILGKDAEISIRLDGNMLNVMGSGSMRTALVIHPRVTNVIFIGLE